MDNPLTKLTPNKYKAMAVYKSQVKKLSKCEKDKVIASEAKLKSLGHVEYVKHLPGDVQKRLKENKIQNYIPWRSVWNLNSFTTECRIVMDASQPQLDLA